MRHRHPLARSWAHPLREAWPGTGWLALVVAGCVGSPPSPPAGNDESSSTGSVETTTSAQGSDGTTSSPPDPSSGSTADDTTGSPAGTPQLEIAEAPSFDYGNIPIPDASVHAFTVTNVGDGPAQGLAGVDLDGMFDYEGGAYPGAGGSCTGSLAGGSSCTIAVAFAPQTLGLHSSTLVLTHDGGADLEVALNGGGAGESPNLLINPGGEIMGSPPTGWTAQFGTWTTGDFTPPFEGSFFITADAGPDNVALVLTQAVDVTEWASTIDEGLIRFVFEAHARSRDPNNDDFQLRLRYRNAVGAELDEWITDWDSPITWTQYQDARLAPAGTTEIVVELRCIKTTGSFCDGYFDALDLHAAFP